MHISVTYLHPKMRLLRSGDLSGILIAVLCMSAERLERIELATTGCMRLVDSLLCDWRNQLGEAIITTETRGWTLLLA